MKGLVEGLIQVKQEGAAAVLATVVEVEGNGRVAAGQKCLVRDGRVHSGTIHHEELQAAIIREAGVRLQEER